MSGVRCLLRALGRLLGGSWVALGGSWEGLGGFWEASKRYLGPKTVRARILTRFLKKIGNFGGPSWRRFNIQNRVFVGFQGSIQDKTDFQCVLASILGRFSRVWKHQK